MRAFRSHPGYDVTFTLMNPQPDLLQVEWHIQDAVDGKNEICWHRYKITEHILETVVTPSTVKDKISLEYISLKYLQLFLP